MADVTLLATADWDHPLWTNKQHVAVSLARLGHRILYIESLGLRGARSGQSSDRLRILRRLRRGMRLPRRVAAGIWVWSPLVIPGARGPLAMLFNRALFTCGLVVVRAWLHFKPDWLWTYNPRTLAYLDPASYRRLIYHCVDDIQAQPGMDAADLSSWEQALCRRASIVFVTSPALEVSRRSFNPSTYFFPNVADHAHFSSAIDAATVLPPELAEIPSPRIGFVGAISAYKLDLCLLEHLATIRPDWSFVLIGPVGEGDPDTNVTALARLANVYFMGAKPYDELPAWLSGIDVAILPLRRNSYTDAMFPMKFFEYLAAGRPVVATAIRSLQTYAAEVDLVDPDVTAFERSIQCALSDDTPIRRQARSHFSAGFTYESRTIRMLECFQAD